MRLPNADRAFVDLQKRRGYCLNPAHPRGQHKARVFAAALGITAREAAWLRTAFMRAACTHDATAGEADAYGRRYDLDISIDGPKGAAAVRITWIVRTGEDFPRLTSCYVL
ncbi:DUF6883 domain-containing protein [uncultured Thiodictyon sp.]|uniref:DUF6883 domain-containing protein n=1 Tax=uncultured Thiodictyon sp. TaxID=1846217 RepID=UPI0025E3381D|nr:DUF6883 domain-containing protein [uncultured Thiodictyon sp.]